MRNQNNNLNIQKCPVGVEGIDELTFGGLPKNRTTLVLGAPGSGKTILGMEFIYWGIRKFDEPGLIVSLNQSIEHLVSDTSSVGIDLHTMIDADSLNILPIKIYKDDLFETGDYNLEGLFVHLERAITQTQAKRVLIDDIDSLFLFFPDRAIVRKEFLRLGNFLNNLGVTSIFTGAKVDSFGQEYRLDEYLSDCVIQMDHRVIDQIATRRLRILKYRGTAHGTNEYPFVITSNGLRVFPVTSTALDYPTSNQFISTGINDLDNMLGGEGFYQGSAILVAGQAGTGKTTLAAQFAVAAATAGHKCVYFSFEESHQQLYRNMASVGVDLAQAVEAHGLSILSNRPSLQGLEQHLAMIQDQVEERNAEVVIIDPISNLIQIGSTMEVKAMVTRLLDGFKARKITVFINSLIAAGDDTFGADLGMSSLMDVIISVEAVILKHKQQRRLMVIKSRGQANSLVINHLIFSKQGLTLEPLAKTQIEETLDAE